MDRSSFKVSKYIKNVGLCGTVIVALLFLSSSVSALEVTTEDGRDEYEQGEIIIFRISGMNNSTVYLNFVHIVTTKIGNNTTYQKDWYGLNPIILNETGKGSLFHNLDYQTVFGNQEATYGDWDFEVFESVNETTIEFLSYRFNVEVNWDLVLREWDDKHEEDKKETKALIAGLDARDNFKNWVIIGLAFLFMMTIATYHLGENPVMLFFKWLGRVVVKLSIPGGSGETDSVSADDENTIEEFRWRKKEDFYAGVKKSNRQAQKLERKITAIGLRTEKRKNRIDETAKARIQASERLAKDHRIRAEALQKVGDKIHVPARRKLLQGLKKKTATLSMEEHGP